VCVETFAVVVINVTHLTRIYDSHLIIS